MAERRDSFEREDFGWLVAMSLVFFALVAIALWREYAVSWRPWQRRFEIELAHAGRFQDARKFHIGIRQIWNPDLDLVDRCVTCHLGYEWNGVLPAALPQPLTPHPGPSFMARHPFERFAMAVRDGPRGPKAPTKADRDGISRCCRRRWRGDAEWPRTICSRCAAITAIGGIRPPPAWTISIWRKSWSKRRSA